jgi:transcriptional regulator with XRE-family HTH domain
MNPVHLIRQHAALTQSELAQVAGTSQPTIASYESEQKSPTFRTLQRLAESSGVVMDLRVYSGLTREDQRSLALHSAIAERLRDDPTATLARARANLARMRERHPGATQLLREWKVLLDRPLDALVSLLTDRSEWARELRHVTPFGGVLTARERTAVYRAFAHDAKSSNE